jgi:hypothetical protein
MLRCQAQLEPFCILAGLVTVLRFGALCDRSSFTSTDAHATDLTTGFLEELLLSRGSVTSSVGVLAVAGDA